MRIRHFQAHCILVLLTHYIAWYLYMNGLLQISHKMAGTTNDMSDNVV